MSIGHSLALKFSCHDMCRDFVITDTVNNKSLLVEDMIKQQQESLVVNVTLNLGWRGRAGESNSNYNNIYECYHLSLQPY